MHIEPLIRSLFHPVMRIIVYVITNSILLWLVEIWKQPLHKIILIGVFLILYMIAYENMGVYYERLKKRK